MSTPSSFLYIYHSSLSCTYIIDVNTHCSAFIKTPPYIRRPKISSSHPTGEPPFCLITSPLPKIPWIHRDSVDRVAPLFDSCRRFIWKLVSFFRCLSPPSISFSVGFFFFIKFPVNLLTHIWLSLAAFDGNSERWPRHLQFRKILRISLRNIARIKPAKWRRALSWLHQSGVN